MSFFFFSYILKSNALRNSNNQETNKSGNQNNWAELDTFHNNMYIEPEENFNRNQLGVVHDGFGNNFMAQQHFAVSFDSDQLQCPECGKKFAQKPNLKAHMKGTHEKIKDYNCSFCKYTSSYKSDVTRHVKLKHP